jgi:hypothetical protein
VLRATLASLRTWVQTPVPEKKNQMFLFSP